MQKILHIFFNDSIMSIAFVKYTEIKYSNFSILGGDKMEQELLKKIIQNKLFKKLLLKKLHF